MLKCETSFCVWEHARGENITTQHRWLTSLVYPAKYVCECVCVCVRICAAQRFVERMNPSWSSFSSYGEAWANYLDGGVEGGGRCKSTEGVVMGLTQWSDPSWKLAAPLRTFSQNNWVNVIRPAAYGTVMICCLFFLQRRKSVVCLVKDERPMSMLWWIKQLRRLKGQLIHLALKELMSAASVRTAIAE